MYVTLLSKINTTLDTLKSAGTIKQHSNVPGTEVTGYPYVFYKPAGFENAFHTNVENEKVYNFLMVIVIGVENTTTSNVFSTVLPACIDAIIEQFDADWNQGTIDGHRVRVLIDSADDWQMDEDKDGRVAYAPLNVQFRLLSTT